MCGTFIFWRYVREGRTTASLVLQSSTTAKMESSMEESYEYHQQRDSERRRSLSESNIEEREERQILIRDSLGQEKRRQAHYFRDEKGVWWKNGHTINQDFLPAASGPRGIFVTRMMELGFGDDRAFENLLEFMLSLKNLVDVSKIDFVLKDATWNFLVASWIMEGAQLGDRDGRFDFETATHIRETVIARRTNAKNEAGATKHMSSYGREFGDESS